MNLLQPLALLGLLTLPAILLLHILRNRRKRLAVSSLRLWRNLERQKLGSLPRGIQLSLLLLLQLIIAIAITLALARPVSSFLLDQPEQTIFILDMTTSMAAVDVPQPNSTANSFSRFDAARRFIQDRIQDLDENDSFAVISLNPHPEILLAGNAEQKTSALTALDDLTPGATGANLAEALTLTTALIDPAQKNQIVVLTDANYQVDSQNLPSVPAPLNWQIIPDDSSSGGNQTLLNVSTRRLTDGRHRVFARVVNYGDTPVVRTLRVIVDGVVSVEDPVKIGAKADVDKIWTLSSQAETAAIEIVEPDILPLDNRAELLLFSVAQRRVLLLSQTPDTLARALDVQPGVELTISPPAATRYNPADFDLIIFDGLPLGLTDWPRGNLLVINPPLGHPLLPADDFAGSIRPDPDTASSLFTGMDLSGVLFNRVTRLTVPEWAEVDLRMADDDESELPPPLVFHGSVNNSRVMVWAFDLNAGNLPARLALPLLTGNILSTLLAPSPPAVAAVGEPVAIDSGFNVEIPDGHRLFLDSGETTGHIFRQTKQPGLYRIYNQNNNLVTGFAVHAGTPLESNLLQKFQPEALPSLDASAVPSPDSRTGYDNFWPWLAGLALVVVTFEGWLAWRK